MRQLDLSNLLLAIQQLDAALKKGININVHEDSLEVTDEHVEKALKNVHSMMRVVANNIDSLASRIVTLN